MIAETEGARTMADIEEAAEADLQAEITGIRILWAAATATSITTEALFETKKVTPETIHVAAITILLKTQNLQKVVKNRKKFKWDIVLIRSDTIERWASWIAHPIHILEIGYLLVA